MWTGTNIPYIISSSLLSSSSSSHHHHHHHHKVIGRGLTLLRTDAFWYRRDAITETFDALSSSTDWLAAELRWSVLCCGHAVLRGFTWCSKPTATSRIIGIVDYVIIIVVKMMLNTVVLTRASQGHTVTTVRTSGTIWLTTLQIFALDTVSRNLGLFVYIFIKDGADKSTTAVSCVETFTTSSYTRICSFLRVKLSQ